MLFGRTGDDRVHHGEGLPVGGVVHHAGIEHIARGTAIGISPQDNLLEVSIHRRQRYEGTVGRICVHIEAVASGVCISRRRIHIRIRGTCTVERGNPAGGAVARTRSVTLEVLLIGQLDRGGAIGSEGLHRPLYLGLAAQRTHIRIVGITPLQTVHYEAVGLEGVNIEHITFAHDVLFVHQLVKHFHLPLFGIRLIPRQQRRTVGGLHLQTGYGQALAQRTDNYIIDIESCLRRCISILLPAECDISAIAFVGDEIGIEAGRNGCYRELIHLNIRSGVERIGHNTYRHF